MYRIVKNPIKKFIEKHYSTWGTEIITKLPAEFVITKHAYDRLTDRLNFKKEKLHKITLKAWKTPVEMDEQWLYNARQKYRSGIYKQFNGNIFVFRLRRHHRLGVPQKFLITVFKKTGFQFYSEY